MSYEGDIYIDDAAVKSVALGKTGTGKIQLAITFEHRTEGVPSAPTSYLYFTDACMEMTEKALRTLGWDPIENQWGIDDMITMGAIIGAKASLVCAWEEWEGKNRFKVKFINEPGGGGAVKERLSSDEASSFTSALRQRLGVTGGAKKKKAAKPAPAAVGADDDEIPF